MSDESYRGFQGFQTKRQARTRILKTLIGQLRASIAGAGVINLDVDFKGDKIDGRSQQIAREMARDIVLELETLENVQLVILEKTS